MSLEEYVTLVIKRLADARYDAGLTQAEAADLLGVDPVTVSRWETQVRSIDLERFIQLCALYNVSPAGILANEDVTESAVLALRQKLKQIQAICEDAPGKETA